ncbi:MAG TPA: hypothetical protein VF950_24435 [Planctomycetota bacterium]
MKSFQLTDGNISFAPPPTCPNCGAPATVSLSYGYMGPLSRTLGKLFGGVQYSATFGYCQVCADQAMAAISISNSFRWFALLGLFVGVCISASLKDRLADGVVLALGIGPGLLIWAGSWWAYRQRKKRKHPPLETQSVWGPAAYYAGTKFLGVREDWIRQLVKLNPDLFDDAVREKWAGP